MTLFFDILECKYAPERVQYEVLSLNGHLSYKTDTWCWSLPFFSHFTVTKLPIKLTPLVFKTDNRHFETVNGHLIMLFFLVKNTPKWNVCAEYDSKLRFREAKYVTTCLKPNVYLTALIALAQYKHRFSFIISE